MNGIYIILLAACVITAHKKADALHRLLLAT